MPDTREQIEEQPRVKWIGLGSHLEGFYKGEFVATISSYRNRYDLHYMGKRYSVKSIDDGKSKANELALQGGKA